MVKTLLKLKSSWGFTLIELLAVMAIVAILAAIVSVAVTGSGQTSRDTQVREDSNSAGNSMADFFDDQPVTELFETLKVTVKTQKTTFTDVTQTISNKFPEFFVTDAYGDAFQVTKEDDTVLTPTISVHNVEFFDTDGGGLVATDSAVQATITANADYSEWTVSRAGNSITLNSSAKAQTLDIADTKHYFELDTTTKVVQVTTGDFSTTDSVAGVSPTTVGEAHVFEVDDLLTDFNAIDWNALDDGGFSTTIPESVDAVSEISDTVSYPQYLWLLEKDEEKGSTGKINSRNVAVFVLLQVIADATNADADATTTQYDLTFRRLL